MRKFQNLVIALGLSFFGATAAFASQGPTPNPKESYLLRGGAHRGPHDPQPWVKFVLARGPGGAWECYLIEGEQVVFHAEFVRQQIRPELDLNAIQQRAFFNQGRELYFGTLFLGKEKFMRGEPPREVFEEISYDIVARDFPGPRETAEVDRVLKVFLSGVIASASSVRYAPLGRFAEATMAQKASFSAIGVQLTERSAFSLYQQVYTPGWGVGTLRVLSAADSDAALAAGTAFPGEILVIDGAPNDLPPAAGYILSLPSAPNSHPALLSQMLGVPLLYRKGAAKEPRTLELARAKTPVVLQAKPEEGGLYPNRHPVYLGGIDTKTYQTLLEWKVRPRIGKLKISPDVPDLLESHVLKKGVVETSVYGSKAAGLMQIQSYVDPRFTIPSLFVPIYFQKEFFRRARWKGQLLGDFVRQTLESGGGAIDLAIRLSQIREAIQGATLEGDLLDSLSDRLLDFASRTRASKLFLRSSSNAEDHEVFNGAGLYDSKSAKLDRVSVQAALRMVWASLYNFKAFWARQEFSIDEATVGMGVVAQGFLPDIKSQGVAVGQLYDEGKKSKLRMTSFPGVLQVTSPPPGVIPETVLVDGFNGTGKELYVQTFCTGCGDALRFGELVVSKENYLALTEQIDRLLTHWPVELDVEWIKSGEQFYLVQARAVPKSKALPHPMLVGASKLSLQRERRYGDSEDPAILRLMSEIQLQLHLNPVPRLGAGWVADLGYSFRGRKVFVQGKDLKIKESPSDASSPWILVPLNNPDVPSLALRIENPHFSDDGETPPADQLLTPGDLEFRLEFNGNLAFPKTARVSKSAYCMGMENCFSPFRTPLEFVPSRLPAQIQEKVEVIGKRKGSAPLRFTFAFRKDEDPKHYSLLVDEVTVEGLLPGKIVHFRNPGSMVYSAHDHHISPELALDLSLADEAAELARIPVLAGGRFLWIFSAGISQGHAEPDDDSFGGVALIGPTGQWLRELTDASRDAVRWR